MNKLIYHSPDVLCVGIVTGTILVGSKDPNTIDALDFYDLIEE